MENAGEILNCMTAILLIIFVYIFYYTVTVNISIDDTEKVN